MCWLTKLFKGKANTLTIESYRTITTDEMSSILLDKLEEMGDNKAELYLADVNCKIYRDEDIRELLRLNDINKITYVAEAQDCDDFAAELYGKGLGLLWTNKHALNWYINQFLKVRFIEPQTDKVSDTLEDWQGWDVRFFLSR